MASQKPLRLKQESLFIRIGNYSEMQWRVSQILAKARQTNAALVLLENLGVCREYGIPIFTLLFEVR